MKAMRILYFVAPCVAIGTHAMGDGFMNSLFQHDYIRQPARRQFSNASSSIYQLVETYDASNFWDKFEFIETTPTNGDPTHGFVLYQNRSEAERLGLISVNGDVAMMKVDSTTTISGKNLTNMGRKSVRVESLATYKEGLIVGDFASVPKMQCGSWPAFWTYARTPGWPNGGEIDIYEQWNTYPFNRQTIHMNSTLTGTCNLSVTHNTVAPVMTNYNFTQDCNVTEPLNVGCSTWDFEGPYGLSTGGVYAMLLSPTTNVVKLWTWFHDNSPFSGNNATTNTSATTVDISTWGTPNLVVGADGNCDVARTFANQTIVLNLEICGDAVTDEDWVGGSGCAIKTGYNSCWRFAAAQPAAFEGVGFGVRSIKIYQAKRFR